jgi:hypothetical protein
MNRDSANSRADVGPVTLEMWEPPVGIPGEGGADRFNRALDMNRVLNVDFESIEPNR